MLASTTNLLALTKTLNTAAKLLDEQAQAAECANAIRVKVAAMECRNWSNWLLHEMEVV